MMQDTDVFNLSDYEIVTLAKNVRSNIPDSKCIYFLLYDDELVYVGQTVNLKNRISVHDMNFNSNTYLGDKKIGVDSFNKVVFKEIDDLAIRKKLEKKFYEMFEPKLNFTGMQSIYALHGTKGDYVRYHLFFGSEKRYDV